MPGFGPLWRVVPHTQKSIDNCFRSASYVLQVLPTGFQIKCRHYFQIKRMQKPPLLFNSYHAVIRATYFLTALSSLLQEFKSATVWKFLLKSITKLAYSGLSSFLFFFFCVLCRLHQILLPKFHILRCCHLFRFSTKLCEQNDFFFSKISVMTPQNYKIHNSLHLALH